MGERSKGVVVTLSAKVRTSSFPCEEKSPVGMLKGRGGKIQGGDDDEEGKEKSE